MKKTFKGAISKVLIIKMTLLSIFTANDLTAQQATNYAVHANIIYHFTKYIDWPGEANDAPFIIGVMGDDQPFDDLISTVANKKAGDRKIIVKKYAPSDDFAKCHILFITEEESGSIKKVTASTQGMPVLIVTETEGAASINSCINFIIEDDRLKLEINRNNIESRKLKIASELLGLGKVIQ